MEFDQNMMLKIKEIKQRYENISRLLTDPAIFSNKDEYSRLARAHANLMEFINTYDELCHVQASKDSVQIALRDDDEELVALAREELSVLTDKEEEITNHLKILLLPKDPKDEKNVIMEIRAGTGGGEAALFAADLFRMYAHFAERKGWQMEILSSNETELGGLKEIIVSIEGKGIYSRLKFESGVHRVQRVPETEASGRIHTSAATVAVLPEAEEVEVEINPLDIRVDVFRSQGHGGQSVNTTDSAVRITHIPTGMVVTCQDEKSQLKNKDKALKILRARLLDKYQSEQHEELAETRRSQIGSGDRSERIRTYNFPQNRLTDHRIDLTLYHLDRIINGDMDEVIDTLVTTEQTRLLGAQI